jgi:cell pole-organizing protein PopZ
VNTHHLAGATATVVVPEAEWREVREQLQHLQQQQLAMAAMMQQLTESSAAAAAALQARIAALEARGATLPPASTPPQQQQQQQQQQSPAAQPQLHAAGAASPRQQQPQLLYGGRSSPGSLAALSPGPAALPSAAQTPPPGRLSGMSRSVDDWSSKSAPGRPPILRVGSGLSTSASALAGVGVSGGA